MLLVVVAVLMVLKQCNDHNDKTAGECCGVARLKQ